MHDQDKEINSYAEFKGAKKEKDRKLVFRIIDYACYASFALLLTAMATDWNPLPEEGHLGAAFFFLGALYTGSHALEGGIDGKKQVIIMFGIPAAIAFVTGILFIYAV
ncbi:MAG: hypothetical protein EA344_03980 [Alkalicoccus sp.]|nr:MAG: hypothetical protein EA344_03980 [Alkalicoccus sp.]